MLVGDYTYPANQSISIDTKQDLQEVISNVVHQHDRFKNECILAREAGIQLIVLVADPKVKTLKDIFSWYNIRRKWSPKATSGRTLAKIMLSFQERYGVRFEFVTKETIGSKIIQLLNGG